ncbi:MAG: hypothetical protein IAG13_12700 [Deltaproteobacteria bacterium]|nr:hypothetical protein [Nannocystaceae bacterium]
MSGHSPTLRGLARLVFWAWLPLAVVLGTSLLATHAATLPVPGERDTRLLGELARMRNDDERGRWMAVHVLYAACRCSRDVVDHLVDDPRPERLAERILMVGSTPEIEQRLAGSAIEVIRVQPQELAERYAIEAAPMLLVVDPDGALRYRGGYSERKQAAQLHDLEIIGRLRGEGHAAALPLFGCPVSDELEALLDPLGLRGGRASS